MRLSTTAIKAIDIAAQKWVDTTVVNVSHQSRETRQARTSAFEAFYELLHSDLPETPALPAPEHLVRAANRVRPSVSTLYARLVSEAGPFPSAEESKRLDDIGRALGIQPDFPSAD